MTDSNRSRGPDHLARSARQVLGAAAARHGFASVDLVASWDGLVGERFAGFTLPERLSWPRGESGPGVLTIRCEGARAVLLQHEAPVLIERVNAFLGFNAVAEVRFVQRPLPRRGRLRRVLAPLDPAKAAALDRTVADIQSDPLREAMRRLGEGVMRSRHTRP